MFFAEKLFVYCPRNCMLIIYEYNRNLQAHLRSHHFGYCIKIMNFSISA
jgi:hypothetical protein